MSDPERKTPAIAIDLLGQRLELVEVDGALYGITVDGERRRIRSSLTRREVGDGGVRMRGAPRRSEDDTFDASELVECIERGATPTASNGKVLLAIHVAGDHFRENRWTDVTIALGADGVVEIDALVSEQDESFY